MSDENRDDKTNIKNQEEGCHGHDHRHMDEDIDESGDEINDNMAGLRMKAKLHKRLTQKYLVMFGMTPAEY